MAADLIEEVGKSPFGDREIATVTKDRDCKRFTKWLQGYSPREHQEMVLNEKQLRLQRKWAKEDRDFRDEQRKEDQKQRWWERIQFWIMLIVGMLVVPIAAALLQVYLPARLQNQKDMPPGEPPVTSKANGP